MWSNKYRNNHKKRSKRPLYGLFLIVLFLIVSAVIFEGYSKRASRFPLPDDVSFGVWSLETKKEGYKLEDNTLQYDKLTSTITFKLTSKKNNNALTFTEQAVPENFAVTPEAFDKQVAGLQQVTKFDSVHGSVAITRPFQDSKETAIMRAQGTLVYVYSDNHLEADVWRGLFNAMELIK